MKDFYEITILSPFVCTVSEKFPNEQEVKKYISEVESGPTGMGPGSISYIVTKKTNYVIETQKWVSHDNIIPGLKAGKWYAVSYAEDDPEENPIYVDDDCG
ncbi:hypothetical protein IKT64_02825 [Candidatus Saccharibacteria bacterium]|nr:hypothetical protein [Candidatus Saccharibacteria bacterium]